MSLFIPPDGTLYLDDKRGPFDAGWQWVKTVAETVAVLRAGEVEHASLDYDLSCSDGENTGADVIRAMASEGLWPTGTLLVHSGSTDGRREMGALVEASGLFDGPEDHPLGPLYRRR